jgi:hypothetical protein
MENRLGITMRRRGQNIDKALVRGIRWGFIGGLTGTLAMDILLIGALFITKQNPLACFAIVGDTVARLFTGQIMDIATCVLLGILTHYSIGPLLGVIFGVAMVRTDLLRADTLKRYILFAIIYLQILSQPLLALAAGILRMNMTQIWLWFGGAFVMHTIMGVILGAVIFYGHHRIVNTH